jgi:hypothetical protein
MPEHFEVGFLENVRVRVVLIEGTEKEGVYAEEGPKLLVEVSLLDIGAR